MYMKLRKWAQLKVSANSIQVHRRRKKNIIDSNGRMSQNA